MWLPLAEHWYNTNYHTGLKMTPFEALYCYPPSHPSLLLSHPMQEEEVKQFVNTRQQIIQELCENLKQAQSCMKLYVDKSRVEREFAIREWVYLKLQPYREQSVALRRNLKLAARYYRPFQITAKIGAVAYRLDLPDGSRIHPVFHVSLLKKVLSPTATPSTDLPTVDQDSTFVVSPVNVLCSRMVQRRGEDIQQLLVQWDEKEAAFSSWEDLKFLRRVFPKFDPWGQGSQKGGSIVVIPAANTKELGGIVVEGGVLGLRDEKGKNGVLGNCELGTKEIKGVFDQGTGGQFGVVGLSQLSME